MDSKVSIIVATYRRNDSLKKALYSLAAQTYKQIEIILVDDNDDLDFSNAVTQIAESFINDNPDLKFRLIAEHTNLGSAKARNKGIQAASGEFITFLDDDDIYLPDKVKRQLEFMQQNNLDYSITDLFLYNDSGRLIERRLRKYIKYDDSDNLLKYHFMYHMTGTDTLMFSTAYLKEIGGFDEIDFGDEFYLMKKAICQMGRFGYLPNCDVKAYVHTSENNLSSAASKISGENELYKYKKNYFKNLDSKTVRYIKMRHYAVLAYAHMRIKHYFSFIIDSLKSFFSSPIQCVKLFIGRKYEGFDFMRSLCRRKRK